MVARSELITDGARAGEMLARERTLCQVGVVQGPRVAKRTLPGF